MLQFRANSVSDESGVSRLARRTVYRRHLHNRPVVRRRASSWHFSDLHQKPSASPACKDDTPHNPSPPRAWPTSSSCWVAAPVAQIPRRRFAWYDYESQRARHSSSLLPVATLETERLIL